MKNLVIAGGGGFGAEAAWVAEEMNVADASPWNLLGYVDDDPSKIDLQFYGYKVLGLPEEVADRMGHEEIWCYCAVGDNAARKRMAARLSGFGWRSATLIHPSVVRAKNVSIGEGTYVAPLSVLSPNCTLGRHVIINQRVAIGHDTTIGDFSNICPGAQVNGFCRVGQSSLVGSNASIRQNCSIGENSSVGANSMVVRDVDSGVTVVGVPARKIAVRREESLSMDSQGHAVGDE